MSLGANFSSGHTDELNQEAILCGIKAHIAPPVPVCCTDTPSGYAQAQGPTAAYSSTYMLSKLHSCPPPTPEELALYPKVAVPSSVLTESRRSQTFACAVAADPSQRFAQYRRYQPASPCQPLPQSANMAGISLPSTRQCNLYNGVNQT